MSSIMEERLKYFPPRQNPIQKFLHWGRDMGFRNFTDNLVIALTATIMGVFMIVFLIYIYLYQTRPPVRHVIDNHDKAIAAKHHK